MRAYRLLVLATVALTVFVIVVGAWVRLNDAGLGCPDWPGCYGRLTPKGAAAEIAAAVERQGGEHGPVSMAKAWKEMFHRYVAGVLGLMILALAVLGWLRQHALGQSPWLAAGILLMVLWQATLGAWTITMLLKPAIVTAHLLGGMATLGLLVWLALRQWRWRAAARPGAVRGLRAAATVSLAVIIVQIALGGWTSTNYAALACPDLPLCRGELVPPMNFTDAFHIIRELGMTEDGDLLPMESLVAIHWVHRKFALIVAVLVGWTAWRALREPELRPLGLALGGALALQLLIGVANVHFSLPLWLAAAHNAGAALLLSLAIVLQFFAFRGEIPRLAGPAPPGC